MAIKTESNSFNAKQARLDPSLHTAISKKNFADCHRLIETRADVNARDSWGWTPLHTAVRGNWPAGYHLLTENGADVSATGAHDVTSLSVAIRAQSLSVVRSLVGQSIGVGKPSGWSPLQLAIRDGHSEAVRTLLEHGAKVEPEEKAALSSLLPIAIRDRRFETVRCLIENGASVDEVSSPELDKLLPAAVHTGHLGMVGFLLNHGIKISMRDNQGLTLLQIAIQNGHLEMVCLLLKNGAIVNPEDKSGLNGLLKTVICHGRPQQVRLLIDHGVPLVTDALAIAITANRPDMIRFLIEAGAPFVSKVVRDANLEIIRFLEKHSVKTPKKGDQGLNLLQIAIREQCPEVVCVLLENGAAFDLADKGQLEELVRSVIRNGRPEIVGPLLGHGALFISDALEIAVKANRSDMIEIFFPRSSYGAAMTALKIAIQDNRTDIALRLINFGLNFEVVMRSLIEEGFSLATADPAMLKMAVKAGHFELARTLIDNGANVDEEVMKELHAQFTKNGVPKKNIGLFCIRLPKLYAPEVFQGDRFRSISEVDGSAFQRPIVLLNVAAYESINRNFGSIAQSFSKSHDPLYQYLAKYFTVVRVHVDCSRKLVPVLNTVKKVFSQLPVRYWALIGHGNTKQISLSKSSVFSSTNTDVMYAVSEALDSEGAIALCGCSSASRNENIAQVFSKNAPGKIVYGAPWNVLGLTSSIIWHSKIGRIPLVIPFFIVANSDSDLSKSPFKQMKAYRDGELVVEAHLPSQSRL